MSFCQKHENHHCVHSHNCTSHKHKKCTNKQNKTHKNQSSAFPLRGNSKDLKKITQENEQRECHFQFNDKNKTHCSGCNKLVKQLEDLNTKFNNYRKQYTQSQTKATKLFQQNRQLHGVIDYYREQMERIIKCGDIDIKNQIKRHLKENTELSAKNSFLSSKLFDAEQQVSKLSSKNTQLSKIIQLLKKQRNQYNEKYDAIVFKLKKLSAEDKNKTGDLVQEKAKFSQIEERYQIIIQQSRKSYEHSKKQNIKLQNENKQLIQELQILRAKTINTQKISKMDQETFQQRENMFKKKLQSNQKQINQLKQIISKLQLAGKLKDEQLLYAKKTIQKQIKNIQQNKQIFEKCQIDRSLNKQNQDQINGNISQKQLGQRFGHDLKNQENYINELKKQIKILKEKIILLEGKSASGHSSQTIQEYILMIGASEAFKRIIDEKNAYIKKLIWEKGALLQQK